MAVDTTQPAVDETRATEDVVRKVIAAFEAGDAGSVLAAYPEDGFTYIDMSEPETVLRSHADLRNWMEEFGSVFDTSKGGVELVSLTAQGPRAVAELKITGRYTGEGAPDDGVDVVLQSCVVYALIEDGLIRTERVYAESVEGQIARALGQ